MTSKLLNCSGLLRLIPGGIVAPLGIYIPLTNTRPPMALWNYQSTPRVGKDIQRCRAPHESLSLDPDTNSEVFNFLDDEILDALEILNRLAREVVRLGNRQGDVVKYGDKILSMHDVLEIRTRSQSPSSLGSLQLTNHGCSSASAALNRAVGSQ